MGNPIPDSEIEESDCDSGAPPSPVGFELMPRSRLNILEARILYVRMTTERVAAFNRYMEGMREIGLPVTDDAGAFINYSGSNFD